ncbi:MAG TPA: YcaO-like family protein [Candidatus Bathyarchaeia archaeon]|nr:YcaO-like family protein [Candidatus Bathyarchaeia archaeon]
MKLILKISEKYFGSSVLLDVPFQLQNLKAELLPAIETASRMKSIGLIREIKQHPKASDEPFAFRYTASPTIDGSGSDLLSEANAIWKTLGESMERSLWRNSDDFYEKKTINASFSEISQKALDIFALAGFSDEQRGKYKSLAFNKNTKFGWLKVHSLATGSKIFCPVQLLSAHYWNKKVKTLECENKPEPMLRWAITTGLATGQSFEEAVVKGILEIIERDAFMITYLNKLSPPEIELDNLAEHDKELKSVLRSFRRYNLEPHIFQLPSDFSVPIMLCLLIDRSGLGPAQTVAASADFEIRTAILDSLSEALSIRLATKLIYKRETDKKNIKREGRMIYWAAPERMPKIDFLLKGKKTKLSTATNRVFFRKNFSKKDRRKYFQTRLESLRKLFEAKKYELVYADIMTKETKPLGLRSVFVLSPELQPMHLDESVPYVSGRRLKEIPEKFGYEPADELNKEPHPFP